MGVVPGSAVLVGYERLGKRHVVLDNFLPHCHAIVAR